MSHCINGYLTWLDLTWLDLNWEVPTAFLFRENRRHGTDEQTDRQTDRRTGQRLMEPYGKPHNKPSKPLSKYQIISSLHDTTLAFIPPIAQQLCGKNYNVYQWSIDQLVFVRKKNNSSEWWAFLQKVSVCISTYFVRLAVKRVGLIYWWLHNLESCNSIIIRRHRWKHS